jgi:Uncharacterized protein conserved in bacteria
MKFEWDEKKNQANYRKHGLRFEEACYIFSDVYALNKFDKDHSDYEDRWIMIGKSPLSNKILVIVHTYQKINGNEIVRIISARKSTKKEQQTYLERTKS